MRDFSITEHRRKLSWLTMSEVRACHGLTLMYKIITGRCPNYLSDLITRSSRTNSIWISKDIKAKNRRNSFFFCMSTLYNKLPENITNSLSVVTFKNKIKIYIGKNKLTLPDHFI